MIFLISQNLMKRYMVPSCDPCRLNSSHVNYPGVKNLPILKNNALIMNIFRFQPIGLIFRPKSIRSK